MPSDSPIAKYDRVSDKMRPVAIESRFDKTTENGLTGCGRLPVGTFTDLNKTGVPYPISYPLFLDLISSTTVA